MTRRLRANQRTAMATDIMQAADRSIVAANDNERIALHLQREVVAGFRNLAGMSDKKPATPPYAFQVGAVHDGFRIKFARQRPARLATRDECVDGFRVLGECVPLAERNWPMRQRHFDGIRYAMHLFKPV